MIISVTVIVSLTNGYSDTNNDKFAKVCVSYSTL